MRRVLRTYAISTGMTLAGVGVRVLSELAVVQHSV